MLEFTDVDKSYTTSSIPFQVLDQFSLSVAKGEFVFLMGSSGVGKSTVLHLAAGLDTPDSGSITVSGTAISSCSTTEQNRLRKEQIGYVFQNFSLVPELSLYDNVRLALVPRRMTPQDRHRLTMEALENVGLAHLNTHYPPTLSGGEQQRGAIARAVVGQKAIILADEPTANLDLVNAMIVIDLLRALSKSQNITVLIATHDLRILGRNDRVIDMAQPQSVAQ